MATVELRDDIKVEIDNSGIIVLIGSDGKACFLHIHPSDMAKLAEFLVKRGHDFRS